MLPAVDNDADSPKPGLRISDFTAVAVSFIQWDIPSLLVLPIADTDIDDDED